MKHGINFILETIHSNKSLPLKMITLIFPSTVIISLFGESTGRTGAVLQIGGTIGDFFGKVLKVDGNNRRVFVMCGISSAFTVLFGSPVSAMVFSTEAARNNIMSYSAFLLCVVSLFISGIMIDCFKIIREHFLSTIFQSYLYYQ